MRDALCGMRNDREGRGDRREAEQPRWREPSPTSRSHPASRIPPHIAAPFLAGYIASTMTSQAKAILWVDDEADLLESHRIFLREQGFEVDSATNADDAVEMLRR